MRQMLVTSDISRSKLEIYFKRRSDALAKREIMGSSMGVGFMAVFAVSGSVVLLVHQVHKRLLSDFMKKVESELGRGKYQGKKKVRFAADVKEPSSDGREYRRRQSVKHNKQLLPVNKYIARRVRGRELDHAVPANRQALYNGTSKYNTLKGQTVPKLV